MRSKFSLALCLFLFPSLAGAQPKSTDGNRMNIFDRFSVAVPTRWKAGTRTATSVEIFAPLSKEVPRPKMSDGNPKPDFVISVDIGMLITMERRRDHQEALRRLAEIASEQPERATTLVISGWPAIERRYRDLMPQPGETEGMGGNITTWFTTTAVAVDTLVIRFDSMLAPQLDPKMLEEAIAVGRSFLAPNGNPDVAARELAIVERAMKRTPPVSDPNSKPGGTKSGGKEPGVAVFVQTGRGELEVAASNDGSHVVVAANSGFSFSDNFGGTWAFGGGTPCNQAACDGDPSLAVGQSGAIYYSWIGGPNSGQLGDGFSRSTDNGHTFPFASMGVNCPGASNCSSADQEHIAADRVNAGGSGDRVYNVWRNFTVMGGGPFSLRIVCSNDSAATWSAQQVIGAGDFPRVAVGRDGFVYVAWASGGNMMLHKYSDCDAGLNPQVGWPVVVSAFTNVVCPVPGLDRCNGRNILSSPVIGTDDLDANHVYYAFATSTGAGNENVMVFDSTDGGATFPRNVRVNNNVAGRRFMSWVSTYGGVAAVSWYDRRNATLANNDLTRFFIGTAWVKGPNLVAGVAETDLSGVNDTHCAAGWPCATNTSTDSESCSTQPQLAGRCLNPMTNPPSGSNTPCDFSAATCVAPEACLNGRGCPKYGDYNGNAAAAGRQYSAWASFVTPVGAAAGANIRVFTSTDLIPSDFFVRDWTSNASSHDGGAQPSTHANFWSSSDVWNQNTNVAGAFPAADWILGDPPSRVGSNFAFARVSRRAAAASTAANADVTVTFLKADYGLGVPYSVVGDEVVTFAAADMTKVTPGHAWTVDAMASTHLCLGVQITGPNGDVFAAPSLDTLAVGPSDPLILIDNNKAQRNLQDTIGSEGGSEMFAIIENAEKFARPMEVGIRWPRDVKVTGRVSIVGGETIELSDQYEARIKVGELKPRERRWLKFSVKPQSEKPVMVDFFDTAPAKTSGGGPSNGFTIQFARAPIEIVVRRDLVALAGVLTRLSILQKNAEAQRVASQILRSVEKERVTAATYLALLRSLRAALERIVASHLRQAGGKDTFDIGAALKDLNAALSAKNVDALATANDALNERLDAHLTMMVRP